MDTKDVTLNQEQVQVLEQIRKFAASGDKSVFVLKGYAGTGKTTMIRAIVPMLAKAGKVVKLMAPTGRAAKVLTERTGFPAATIHKTIYEWDHATDARHDEQGNLIPSKTPSTRANGVDDLQYFFNIRKLDDGISPDSLVCIVDEASMVASSKVSGEILHFGTDVLLDDLFTYGQPRLGGKFIFVGDPAQLPPVGDSHSAALDVDSLEKRGLSVDSCELRQVMRQDEGSAILANAMKVRDLLASSQRNTLVFDRVPGQVDDITPQGIINDFIAHNERPCLGGSIVVCYSNSMVSHYNESLRNRYFSNTTVPQVGDVVQVVRNNYGYDLYNGDFAQITQVAPSPEKQSAPVWVSDGASKKQETVELLFRNVELLTQDGRKITCKIVESLLGNSSRALTPQEIKALYINFNMRHPELKKESDIALALMNDPYYNALWVKYGYAITCHKAQGGEWDTAYVDYTGRTGLDDDSLRWAYTATTRASRQLWGVAMPRVQPLGRLVVNPIAMAGQKFKPSEKLASMDNVPGMPAGATDFQKAKYLSVMGALDELGYGITSVEFLYYADRYHLVAPDASVCTYDLMYKAGGQYSGIRTSAAGKDDEAIREALASTREYRYSPDYQPETTSLAMLHNNMLSHCDELGIAITDVVKGQYHVVYHLKTAASSATIQFYYKGSGVISHANPVSTLGASDENLIKLINKLK